VLKTTTAVAPHLENRSRPWQGKSFHHLPREIKKKGRRKRHEKTNGEKSCYQEGPPGRTFREGNTRLQSHKKPYLELRAGAIRTAVPTSKEKVASKGTESITQGIMDVVLGELTDMHQQTFSRFLWGMFR